MANSKLQVTVNQFLKVHCGKRWGAALLGSTSPMFDGYCCLLESWLRADSIERQRVEECLRQVLLVFEHHGHPMSIAQLAIPAIGDWAHVDILWPRIAPDQFKLIDWRPADCRGGNRLLRKEEPVKA